MYGHHFSNFHFCHLFVRSLCEALQTFVDKSSVSFTDLRSFSVNSDIVHARKRTPSYSYTAQLYSEDFHYILSHDSFKQSNGPQISPLYNDTSIDILKYKSIKYLDLIYVLCMFFSSLFERFRDVSRRKQNSKKWTICHFNFMSFTSFERQGDIYFTFLTLYSCTIFYRLHTVVLVQNVKGREARIHESIPLSFRTRKLFHTSI